VGKPEGKRLLRRPKRKWKDKMKYDGSAWTGLIWLRIGTSHGLWWAHNKTFIFPKNGTLFAN